MGRLSEFHDSRPGITEAAFLRASHRRIGTCSWAWGAVG